MTPYHDANGVTIYHGDCLEVMRGLPDASVDSVVTDPPYGLSFMGKRWDYDVPAVSVWREALRVLKPGGHLIAFGGSRTYHRLVVNVEDAGFEVRDQIIWMYGSGFPKSLDVSKAIDKEAGAEREVVGTRKGAATCATNSLVVFRPEYDETSPTTDAAKQWDGWGTALKPSHEPAVLARKPFPGTVAQNVQTYGTGALNVDGCRIGTEPPAPRNAPKKIMRGGKFHAAADTEKEMSHYNPDSGRWPANIVHDGSEEVLGVFPVTGASSASMRGELHGRIYGNGKGASGSDSMRGHDDNGGSASRFFYCAKASPSERGPGNNHPTVKPIALMRYLCRLVTPPGGVVLDPFAGSGTTAIGARLEGFRAVLCEREASYLPIITGRLGCEVVQDEAGGATLRPAPQDQLSLFHEAA